MLTASFLKNDLPFFRNALIAFACSLVLSIVLVSITETALTHRSDEKNQLEAQRDSLRAQSSQLEAEKQGIREFQPLFEQLRAHHLIGDEKRLEWVEAIQNIQSHRKLPPLTYEIAEQQPFVVDPSVSLGDFELRGSKMQLHMQLLHEMDLFNFLEDLNRVAQYAVQSCEVGISDSPQPGPLSPRYEAECTLLWITLGERVNTAAVAAAQ